jgi:putative transposase
MSIITALAALHLDGTTLGMYRDGGTMPRGPRVRIDGAAYHLLTRGNRKQTIFHKSEDYQAFLAILEEAHRRFDMPLCGLCLMSNHVHLLVWPDQAYAISEYMHWVLNVHVHRYHRHYSLTGLGHLYQDRYKAFPIQDDRHLYTVMRYVEANPIRASLIDRAEDWEWSSASLRRKPVWEDILSHDGRFQLPPNWLSIVNQSQPKDQLAALRRCARLGEPFGDPEWMERVRRNGSSG